MPPRPKKPSTKLTNKLLEAISFLSCITKEEGAPYETHILLQNKTAVACSEILSAGVLIDEDLFCGPHTNTFKQALSKCGDGYSLTIDNQKIIVTSNKFKAYVPCIDTNLFSPRYPDPISYQIDDTLKEAFKCIDIVKPEPNADKIYLLAFLLNGQSVISTDGKIAIEYWHGLQLPTVAIPKIIIPILLKNTKRLVGLGLSQFSITFYYEDNSWIKTQLYAEQFPLDTLYAILNKQSNPVGLPADFYKALDAVAPFSPKGSIYFEPELMCSHPNADGGASYQVQGLPKGPIYNVRYLNMIKDIVEKIDFVVPGDRGSHMCYFFGKQCRGVITGYG